MKCFPIIWSGSKPYVNRLGSSAITNKYKQEKKILDLLLLVHLLLSFLLLTLLRLLTLSFVYIDIHFVYLLLITISGTVLVRKGFKGIVLSRFRFFFLLSYSYWIGLFSSFERIIHWRTRCQRKRLVKPSRKAFKVL